MLLIWLTRLLTLRSIDESPKSTTRPPWMLELTFCVILRLFPPPVVAMLEFLSADSRRCRADLSRGWMRREQSDVCSECVRQSESLKTSDSQWPS